MKKIIYLCVASLFISGCHLSRPTNSPMTDTIVSKKCSASLTYLIVEKSDVLNQVGEKSFVLASEFQTDPILLSVSPEIYSALQVGKNYYMTFEGLVEMSIIENKSIPIASILPSLQLQTYEEVEPHGLENPQQPLTCK